MDIATRHRFMRALGVTCLFLLGTMILNGCRQSEQGRIINYQAGVYKGKKDTPLSAKARMAIKERVYLQAGATGMPSGRSTPIKGDVRPPAKPSTLNHDALKQRLRAQSG